MSTAEAAVAGVSTSSTAGRPAAKLSVFRHPRFHRVLLVVAVALAGIFALWWFHYRPFVSTDDARVAAPMIVVASQGTGGRVDRVLTREGQVVQPGDPLVELDAAAERAQVERARALVALADARIGEAEAQLQLERRLSEASEQRARANDRSARAAHQRTVRGPRAEDIAKARADVSAAESLATQARRDVERAEALSRGGAIALVGLDAAQTAQASARATLEARRASLELLEHGSRSEDILISQGGVMLAQAGLLEAGAGVDRVAQRTRQVEEARAQAAQARAELAFAEVTLGRMTLRSSVGGTVVRVTVDPGDSLSAGQGAVTIVDLGHAWIAANIEETSAGVLRPGQPVRIVVDEGGELSGRVDVITQSAASQFALIPADSAAGNFTKVVQRIPIHIAIDPSPRIQSLRIGQSVEVRVRVR